MIEIVGTQLHQWDIGRVVRVTGVDVAQVHFANKGDSKAVIMGITDDETMIPDYLLQTGKQLCVYAVNDGVTVESRVFYVINRERPEEYVYEEDRRNYIYELITNTETAIDNANAATQLAEAAAKNAIESASNAVQRANEAASAAETAAADTQIVTRLAQMAVNAADQSSQNADRAAESVHEVIDIAIASATAANDAASKADNATSRANTATENANKATTNANTAAGNANTATDNANAAAQVAENAATLATRAAAKAVENADAAAENANKSADKALHTAKSLMVVGKVEGTRVYLDDAINQFIVGMRIFGKTTQGVPSIVRPAEFVNIGDTGTISVEVFCNDKRNGMIVDTPNGLAGNPVASDGNCIDKDGQPWICDEIDLAKGLYIKRVIQKTFKGGADENWERYSYTNRDGFLISTPDMKPGKYQSGFCDKYPVHASDSSEMGVWLGLNNNVIYMHNADRVATDVESWKVWLSSNPVTIQYILATPIETPLPEQILEAFAQLKTCRGSTTISTDSSAHMAVEYVMDAKKYIDRMIASNAPSARIVEIYLPAYNWKGGNNLYSQVVNIDGITENSQVNLNLSVDQMAIFYNEDITFITENNGGTVTVYVIGQRPQESYTIQADIVEVVV